MATTEEDSDFLEKIIESSKDRVVTWADVCGLENAKEALDEAVVLPINKPELFADWVQPRNGILLYGPPGTGKTYLARAVAGEAKGSTFYAISAADMTSKLIGESERLIFTDARAMKPSVIFIDEVDAICTKRSKGSDAARGMKLELFAQMDGAAANNDQVFVLAATNTPQDLDDAFVRRFEQSIHIPLPDVRCREIQLSRELLVDGSDVTRADIKKLAPLTNGFSGSDLSRLCRAAKVQSIKRARNALYFKEVVVDEDIFYKACAETDQHALKMGISEIPAWKLLPEHSITSKDVFSMLPTIGRTVDETEARKMEEYCEKRGGRRAQDSAGYVRPFTFFNFFIDCIAEIFGP